jgi:hypothetical protein
MNSASPIVSEAGKFLNGCDHCLAFSSQSSRQSWFPFVMLPQLLAVNPIAVNASAEVCAHHRESFAGSQGKSYISGIREACQRMQWGNLRHLDSERWSKMTEQEWLACNDPQKMLEFIQGEATDRKLRLFCCACCRRIWPLLANDGKRAVEVAERYADGLVGKAELIDPWPLNGPPYVSSEAVNWAKSKAASAASDAARMAAADDKGSMSKQSFTREVAFYAAGAVAWTVAGAAKSATEAGSWASAWNNAEACEYMEQALLLRDLFGNPYSPLILAPSWITADVITLAGHVYHDRSFHDMSELADALEDTACTNSEILNHCRREGPHTRGCWLLDLILGKK